MRAKTRWALEKVENENGQEHDTLVRYRDPNGYGPDNMEREEFGTVDEFIRLFEACQSRWDQNGWDIDKLILAVKECSFD